VDRECHDFCAVLALGVEPVKLIDRALEQVVALMVPPEHHWDVVEFYRVGKGDERTLGAADHGWLAVVEPVIDVFDTSGSEQFGVQGLREAGVSRRGRVPVKLSITVSERSIIAAWSSYLS